MVHGAKPAQGNEVKRICLNTKKLGKLQTILLCILSNLQNRPSRPNNSNGAAQNDQKKVVIGESSNSVLKASETLQIPKAVYRLGNIHACYSVTDVRS